MRLKRYSKSMLYLLICKSEIPLLKDKFLKTKCGEEICLKIDGFIENNMPVNKLQISALKGNSKLIYDKDKKTLKLFINMEDYIARMHILETGKDENLEWLFEDEEFLFPFETLEVCSKYSINWFSIIDIYED